MKNPVDFNRFGLLLASLAAAIAAVCLFLLPVPQTNSNEKREGALRLLGVSGSFGPEDLYRKFGKPLKVSFWQDKHSDLHEPKAWDIEYRGVVFHITHSAEMGGYTVNWIDTALCNND